MNESNDQVRPATRILKRVVAAALAQQKPSYHGTEPRALLLLESDCSGLPVALIEDNILEPLDKLIWLVLMVRACRSDGLTSMPTHKELAESVNVASRQAASRSLLILRCRRWLTVCHTSWRKGGKRRGSAFAMHVAPMPIADTIYLDPRYVSFLKDLTGQHQGRVGSVASAIFGQISHQSV